MQQMQVQVPAGVGPGMGFMVAGPDGSQFQVQCPPDAKEGMMITVAVPTPAVAVAQPMMMAQQPVGFGQQTDALILDAMGRTAWQGTLHRNGTDPGLESGAYTVVFQGPQGLERQRLLIQ